MRSWFGPAAPAAVLALFALLPLRGAAAPVLVPAHLLIAVELTAPVASASAKPGDEFHFQTSVATVIGGREVIPWHTPGTGVIAAAAAAGGNGKVGSLMLEAKYLNLAPDQRVLVSIDHSQAGTTAQGTRKHTPWFVSWLPIPFVGFAVTAADQIRPGSNVTLGAGTPFNVYTSVEMTIQTP